MEPEARGRCGAVGEFYRKLHTRPHVNAAFLWEDAPKTITCAAASGGPERLGHSGGRRTCLSLLAHSYLWNFVQSFYITYSKGE